MAEKTFKEKIVDLLKGKKNETTEEIVDEVVEKEVIDETVETTEKEVTEEIVDEVVEETTEKEVTDETTDEVIDEAHKEAEEIVEAEGKEIENLKNEISDLKEMLTQVVTAFKDDKENLEKQIEELGNQASGKTFTHSAETEDKEEKEVPQWEKRAANLEAVVQALKEEEENK